MDQVDSVDVMYGNTVPSVHNHGNTVALVQRGQAMVAQKQRLYMISVVSEMLGIHPQTLRLYEREGFIKPKRSGGNTRLYSEEDVEKLEMVLRLTRELGVNLAGVEVILSMREKMEQMRHGMQETIQRLHEELEREMRRRKETEKALVPIRRIRVTRHE